MSGGMALKLEVQSCLDYYQLINLIVQAQTKSLAFSMLVVEAAVKWKDLMLMIKCGKTLMKHI